MLCDPRPSTSRVEDVRRLLGSHLGLATRIDSTRIRRVTCKTNTKELKDKEYKRVKKKCYYRKIREKEREH